MTTVVDTARPMQATLTDIEEKTHPAPDTGRRSFRALTSIRIVGALVILLSHMSGLFNGYNLSIEFGETVVQMFFLITGFVIALRYTELKSRDSIQEFFALRAAKIVPSFLASFALCILILPVSQLVAEPGKLWPAFFISLFMMQGACADLAIRHAFDGPAWTLATDWLFYFCYPVGQKLNGLAIVRNPHPLWRAALLISFFALSALLAAAAGAFSGDFSYAVFAAPFSRLFDCLLGVACFSLFPALKKCWKQNLSGKRLASRLVASCLELAAPCAVVLFANYLRTSTSWTALHMPGAIHSGADFFWSWLQLRTSGILLAFLLLTYALEEGLVSRFLAGSGLLIYLGEVSGAIYLIHRPLLNYYANQRLQFANLPQPLLFAGLVLFTVLAGCLLYELVETPGRKCVRSWFKRRRGSGLTVPAVHTRAELQKWPPLLRLARIAAMIIVCVMVAQSIALKFFGDKNCDKFLNACNAEPQAVFANSIRLDAVQYSLQSGFIRVDCSWKVLSESPHDCRFIGVHLLDSRSHMIAQFDHRLLPNNSCLNCGNSFHDRFYISLSGRNQDDFLIGLASFDEPSRTALITGSANTDWGGHRLLLPLKLSAAVPR